MGVAVPDVAAMLTRFDADGNGTLSFAEFASFAQHALRDPSSRSLFVTKRALARSAR